MIGKRSEEKKSRYELEIRSIEEVFLVVMDEVRSGIMAFKLPCNPKNVVIIIMDESIMNNKTRQRVTYKLIGFVCFHI